MQLKKQNLNYLFERIIRKCQNLKFQLLLEIGIGFLNEQNSSETHFKKLILEYKTKFKKKH